MPVWYTSVIWTSDVHLVIRGFARAAKVNKPVAQCCEESRARQYKYSY